MKNWKTTLSGVALIIGGVSLFVNNPEKVQEAIGMAVMGIGLIFSADAKKEK